MKKTDFAQSTLQVDGAPLRFTDRPYIYTIYNTDATEKLIMAGRQAEKSTTVAADMICESIAPHNKLLYVTPTMQQTGVFSRSKIDEMFLTSRKLRGALYEKMNSSVGEKRLKNYTTMYFRSAYHTADSIRGITSRRTYTDEVQDILSDILPVIDECSGHQPDAKFIRTGTPKTQDNTIEKKWGHSTQCEWMVKCEACNYWNTLTNTNIIHLDEPGLFCAKCGNRIYTNYGVWVSAHPDNFIKGFRLPQIILPEKYIDWGRLFHKMRTYPTAQLMNEVFGVSYDNAQKPITKEDLVKCCQEYEMDMKWKPQYTSRPVFIGIDWGTGDKSYSVLCAGVMTGKDKFKVIYLKKFIGTEADKDSMLRIIIDTVKSLRSPIIGVDWGFGWGVNSDLRKKLPGGQKVVEFFSSGNLKEYAKWDGQKIILNRTEAMTNVILMIQRHQMQFPKWEQFQHFADDFLSIFAEYNTKTRRMQYDHPEDRPDDAFHATMYAYLMSLHYYGKLPLTREDL